MNRFVHFARAAVFAGVMSGCVVWSAAALAADTDALPRGSLVVHGADFASPRAVAHIKRRLDRVAMAICTADEGPQVPMNRSEQACYDTAVKDGLAQIDSRQQQAMRNRTVELADSSVAGHSAR